MLQTRIIIPTGLKIKCNCCYLYLHRPKLKIFISNEFHLKFIELPMVVQKLCYTVACFRYNAYSFKFAVLLSQLSLYIVIYRKDKFKRYNDTTNTRRLYVCIFFQKRFGWNCTHIFLFIHVRVYIYKLSFETTT